MIKKIFDPTTEELAGPKIIEASAGTGKTHSITSLYLRLLLEKEMSVDQILVVTFTEAATSELRAKIRSRLADAAASLQSGSTGPDLVDPVLDSSLEKLGHTKKAEGRLQQALRSFDEASIFTIHGFCHRMLHESAFDGGFPFESELVTDHTAFLQEIVRDFLTQELAAGIPDFVRHATAQKKLKDSLYRLAGKIMHHPNVQLHPAEPKITVTEALAFHTALAQVQTIWQQNRAEVLACLQEAIDQKNLKAVSYTRAKLEVWAQDLDVFLGSDPAFSTLPQKSLEYFCTRKLISATRKNQSCPTHPFFSSCQSLHSAAKEFEDSLADQLVALKHRLVAFVREQVPLRRRRQNILFYEDLLRDMDQALKRDKVLVNALRTRFRAALIDEFQDTSRVQYRIFKTIFDQQSDHLFLIGDPKQAIYGFRNADIYTYLEAVRDARTSKVTLETNWRSDPVLIDGVNHFFSSCQSPFLFREISFTNVKAAKEKSLFSPGKLDPAPIQFLYLPLPPNEITQKKKKPQITKTMASGILPPLIAEHITKLLQSEAKIGNDPLHPGDIAVLVRTNEQAREIQKALRSSQIPSVIYSQDDILASRETDELMRIIAAAADPGSGGLLRAAITTQALGYDATNLDDLAQDEDEWASIVERFRSYHQTWQDRGFISMMRRLEAREGVRERLVGYPDGERRITNWNHLIEVLHVQSRRERLGPRELMAWLQKRRSSSDHLAEMRLESDAAAVQVVTMHRCKGLEYSIVFCPYLWEGVRLPEKGKELIYHDPENNDHLTMDFGATWTEKAKDQTKFELNAEGMRLLYVALTRAKHRLFLIWGGFNTMQEAPLSALLHPSPERLPDQSGIGETARVKGFEDEFLLGDLLQLTSSKPHLFHLQILDSHPLNAPQSLAQSKCQQILKRLPYLKKPGTWLRIGSFSSLISREVQAERDHDHLPEVQESTSGLFPSDQESDHRLSQLADFPKGARAGECFHKIFEKIDFTNASDPSLCDVIESELMSFGFDVEQWSSKIAEIITDIIATELKTDQDVFRLQDIPAHHRLNELEFVFPVRNTTSTPEPHKMLTGSLLSRILTQHSKADWLHTYATRIPQLHVTPLAGFLKGFIDLVFCLNDKWYLIDYKSNFLGPELGDYAPIHLLQAMQHHHYVLQYHIYAVALHRYLQKRQADYAFDDHFGGVLYLFIRGISSQNNGETGVFFDRPSERLIKALSDACSMQREES